MDDLTGVTRFVATLVFATGQGRRVVESHAICATHPVIAYQCAVARACEPRYEREFVGLAELAQTEAEVSPVGRTEAGDARELVVPKAELAAFSDPRWISTPCDPAELATALTEPPLLAEMAGLDDIDWGRLSHAYGPALDVPLDLRRLASSDAAVREAALWQLGGSIYHQGDVFNATAAAVPFLSRSSPRARRRPIPTRSGERGPSVPRSGRPTRSPAPRCRSRRARSRPGWPC